MNDQEFVGENQYDTQPVQQDTYNTQEPEWSPENGNGDTGVSEESFSNVFIKTFKTYLWTLPIVIIPIAGLLLIFTAAPYYAVNKGCKIFTGKTAVRKRNLALAFSLTLATILTSVLLGISYFLAANFNLFATEYLIISLLYGSLLFFSLLGTK